MLNLSRKMKLHLSIVFFMGFMTLASAQKKLYSDSITVNFFLLDECRICQYYGPIIKQIHTDFSSEQIIFNGYFPNFSYKKEQIALFKEEYALPFDLKTDYFKKQSKRYNLEVLPTVVIYDEREEKILYQGRIDNRFYGVGKQRQITTHNDLIAALEAITKQQAIEQKSTQPVGCFINFADNISRSN